jgi:hypothetical protein
MTLQMVRKPPTNKAFNERLKITLAGNHTLKQKTCMLMQAKFFLEHEHGIGFAGATDVYIALIDEHGHPLTCFGNRQLVADWSLLIDSPYHCAADSYQP